MTCKWIKLPDGTLVHMRISGRRPAKCRWCRNDSTRLCDGKRDGKTCDAPMCDDHRYALDPERDLCPPCRARWTGQPVVVNGVTLKP